MSRFLSLAVIVSLGFASSAYAGHGRNNGCCCQNSGMVYAQPQAPLAASATASAAGYRSYSYEPTTAATPASAAPLVAAPVTNSYRSYSYGPPSEYGGYLGPAYNPPAQYRGWNNAGWKQRR